ncbi:hypothetical protein [Lysobacter niastensis]|uniref:Uncharacterized protein n=1 Tax=Lysobacter niastensis TaxID=380629 RepID=A0ABS0B2T4_9GAMM|nr:hypothetical protein [Lysobacter niastensis]MBF6022796.1 hypothetical protein [Lysobacter niastensis]
MDEQQAAALQTGIAAQRILTLGARLLSTSLDHFSGWLLAGFGAVFGLLIANIDSLKDHITTFNVMAGAVLFLIAAGLAALQKLLAAYLTATTASAAEGREIGREIAESELPVDVQEMYRQVAQGLFWPLSAFNRWMTAKANKGDVAVVGRHHAKAAQIQFLLVLLQSALSIVAAAFVVAGIKI